ncbi:chemokine-like protein TAFA-5 isoform X2 [Manis javanica]|uniref:chemokine-like protein TAFA-5 isoform X2 n=1 Tax=Manis javanica TaxID=9974 RepID=UPI003C6D3E45
MAPSPRTGSRQDATALPSMSSTFWAFMILAGLLVAYCSQLAAGTCEIVTLDRDSSQPRRTIARQTARCACRKGQIAGTTRARPACVDAGFHLSVCALHLPHASCPAPIVTASHGKRFPRCRHHRTASSGSAPSSVLGSQTWALEGPAQVWRASQEAGEVVTQ